MGDEIAEALEVARQEAARTDLPRDDPYLELMATHVELGELLLAGVTDAWGEEAAGDLVNELVAIARDQGEYDEQQFAVWLSRITNGGEVEGGQ